MIFGHTARAVIEGRKTQTRRIPGEVKTARRKYHERRGLSATYQTNPWVPVVGKREPVQPGRGRQSVGHIVITDVRLEPVGAITFADARAEGFRTREDFFATWVRIHDSAWVAKHKVDLADALGFGVVSWILCERFRQEHADTMVHAITFELAVDTPRFMSVLPIPGKSGDYTTSASRSIEPTAECIDAATQERYSKPARQRSAQLRRTFQDDLEEERAKRRNARNREQHGRGVAHPSAAALESAKQSGSRAVPDTGGAIRSRLFVPENDSAQSARQAA